MHISFPLLAASIGLANSASISAGTKLPVVDLGYVRQRAIAYNSTGTYYNFTNIAFAQPPLGSLRFSAPQAPTSISGIQTGLSTGAGRYPNQCPQAQPQWLTAALEGSKASSPPPGPGQTEDCLYLDVFAPKKIFDQAGNGTGAPVLVWIYGGGYVLGSKAGFDPATLITVGENDTSSEGVVFVAMNYRLGAFGWLGGSDFTSQGGSPNNGLLDQRLALQWVQRYISKFGGDPSRVTVMGESGGATSIVRHLTARSSNGQPLPVPFEQATLQSPAELSLKNDTQNNEQYEEFLHSIGASNLSDARKISTKKLQSANFKIIDTAPAGQFVFGATIDGTYVRGQASNALVADGPNKQIGLMTSHNSDEGYVFIPSSSTISSPSFNFTSWVATTLQNASPQEVAYVVNTLYPPAGKGTPWKNQYGRVDTFASEVLVDCNEYGAQLAFNKTGYAYEFAVAPGWHVQDVYSTFYNGANDNVPPYFIDAAVATDMQRILTTFAVSGNPNNPAALLRVPVYGSQNSMLRFTDDRIGVVKDSAANSRCDYWMHRNSNPGGY